MRRWCLQSRQAEAERLRRAKVIDAEGELQAPEKPLQAKSWPRRPRPCSCATSARFSISLARGVQQSILLRWSI
jgi:hypothetical protein